MKPETATTATLDISYARNPWETNVTLFGSNRANATEIVAVADDRVRLVNLPGDSRIRGVETLLRQRRVPDGRWKIDAWAPTDGYVPTGGIRLTLE